MESQIMFKRKQQRNKQKEKYSNKVKYKCLKESHAQSQ